jgi:hypothetical protein
MKAVLTTLISCIIVVSVTYQIVQIFNNDGKLVENQVINQTRSHEVPPIP